MGELLLILMFILSLNCLGSLDCGFPGYYTARCGFRIRSRSGILSGDYSVSNHFVSFGSNY